MREDTQQPPARPQHPAEGRARDSRPPAAQRLGKLLGSSSPAPLKGWVLGVESRASPRAAWGGNGDDLGWGRQAGWARLRGADLVGRVPLWGWGDFPPFVLLCFR